MTGPAVLIVDAAAESWATRLAALAPELRYLPAVDRDRAMTHAPEVEVIVGLDHAVPPEVVAAATRLRFVQALTTGTDKLQGMGLPRGVTLCNARGIHGPQMSELAILMMLSLGRDVPRFIDAQRAARWERRPQPLLLGKTLTIVGLGAIAERLAPLCKAFGMRVIGVSSGRTAVDGCDAVEPRSRLAEACAEADFVVVLLPLTDANRNAIDARVLEGMKATAYLINLARGGVVDESALLERLRDRRIAGAGLDVFGTEPLPADSPFWSTPNVIVTPHIGGVSDVYMEQALPLVAANLTDYARGRLSALRNVVQPASEGSAR